MILQGARTIWGAPKMADAVQVNLQQHPQAKIVNSGADKIIWKCSCWCSGKLYAKHLMGELNYIYIYYMSTPVNYTTGKQVWLNMGKT